MTKKLIVNLKDINQEWLDKLKEQHGNAILEIIVSSTHDSEVFEEALFWQIIDMLDWSKGTNTNEIIQAAVSHLENLSVEKIFAFQDLLAHHLYQLDKKIYAQNIGKSSYGNHSNFSTDTFLYFRAAVVANGKTFYEQVLETPTDMPKEFTFEALLDIAPKAFFNKTGNEWNYVSNPSFETYSNSEGWDGKSWLDQIL